MRFSKVRLASLALTFFVAGFIGNTVAAQTTGQQFVSIGTAGVTGVYYPAGGAICRLVNKNRKKHGIRCSAESTDGSIYNINTIRAGELEFGVVQSDWQYHAYNGTSDFADEGRFEKLRSVFSVHSEPVTIVARVDAEIAGITDLKGKRLNIGNAGSGTRATWDVLEAALGWTRDKLALAGELESSETGQAVCDNRIDSYFWLVGHPSALTQETLSTCDAVLVNVTGPAIDKLIADHTFYRKAIIPAGMYNNIEDIVTFGVGATVVTSADVPDEVVYVIAKAVLSNLDEFRSLHPALANLRAEEMIKGSLSAPLHPGAIEAYKELGLM